MPEERMCEITDGGRSLRKPDTFSFAQRRLKGAVTVMAPARSPSRAPSLG